MGFSRSSLVNLSLIAWRLEKLPQLGFRGSRGNELVGAMLRSRQSLVRWGKELVFSLKPEISFKFEPKTEGSFLPGRGSKSRRSLT